MGPLAGVLILGVFVARAALAASCAYPDEGVLPLRRAVTQLGEQTWRRFYVSPEGKLKE